MKHTACKIAVLVLGCMSPVVLSAAGPCNSSTLNGTYLYRITGTIYTGGTGVHTTGPAGDFAAVGLLRLNNGSGTGVESSSNVGVLGQRTFTITYKINDQDCSANTDLSYCPENCLGAIPGLNNLVMASDGSYAWFVNTVPNTSLTGELRKVPGGACTVLSGSYNQITSGAGLNGRGNAQPVASTARFASVGAAVAGGSTQDIAAFGGLIIPRTYTNPAALNPDCTGELGVGSLNPAKIYAAGDGSEAVVLNWFPGTIVSGWLRRQ